MYFLPKEDLDSCPVAGRLANNVKLMRQVGLPLKPFEWEYLVKFGRNLVFHKIDWMTGEISSRKFDHNGVVQEFRGDRLSKPGEFGVSRGVIYFDSLPIIGTQYPLKGLKKVKFSFYTIPGIIPDKIKMKDVIVDLGCRFHSRSVCVSSNYVALIANIGYADAPRSWTSRLNSHNKLKNQAKYQKLMILLKIERENDNLYNFIEISRNNLERSIQGSFSDEAMIYNKTEDTILFTAKTFNQTPNYLMLLIYNVKSKSIQQSIEAMEDPRGSKVFFLDHVDYEGGVIVIVSFYKNQVRLFSKIGKKGYSLLKCFSMNFTSVLENYSCCCSNRHSQILFFLVKRCEVIIFDLFDTSDFAVLPYGVDERPPQLYFNESREEIYVHYDQRTLVYLYKSMLKSLFLQSALIIAKLYTKAQLRDMNLPRQLYKYLNTLCFLSSEANTIQ